MNIIEVNQLGKKYKRYTNKWHRLLEWFSKKKIHEEKWVLRGISFKVRAGESIGIVGHNGAGKSTLLKLLTGTSYPSEGSISITGKVSALLELGLGFHPDFTGIQNVYMSGQLMGLSSHEIDGILPDIIDFAEIGDYLYQPLRTYSSGMVIRLAFSTITAVRPDILIVDEALSVGDTYFQHKCFNRIRKYRDQGTSILFVSHDPGAVKSLCDRAILIDHGLMVREGNPDEILDYYNAIIAKREADYEIKQSLSENQKVRIRSGNEDVLIDKVELMSNGEKVNAVRIGEDLKITITIKCIKDVNHPTVGFIIKDRLGNDVYGTNSYYLEKNLGNWISGQYNKVIFGFPANIGAGTYSISVAVHDSYNHIDRNYDWIDQAATLQVVPGEGATFIGISYLPTTVELNEGGAFNEQ